MLTPVDDQDLLAGRGGTFVAHQARDPLTKDRKARRGCLREGNRVDRGCVVPNDVDRGRGNAGDRAQQIDSARDSLEEADATPWTAGRPLA